MHTVRHWKSSWSTISARFRGHRWYSTHGGLQYEWSCVWNSIFQLGHLRGCYVLTYKSGLLDGFCRWREAILAPQRNPDLQGSCSLAYLRSISDRCEHNSSILWHTVCDPFMGYSESLKRSLCNPFIGHSAAGG